MIAKITNGTRVGDIAGYLHGPGRANEHRFEIAGHTYTGGRVIGGNLGYEGHTEPDQWVKLMRQALNKRPEAKKPVWQCSLRNTANDRQLTDAEWADAGQSFAESMGFEGHPWVMVRHGVDHVHLVVSRVNFEGQLWSRSNDRRKAQNAASALEDAYGLEKAPRTRQAVAERRPRAQVHQQQREKAQELEQHRQIPRLHETAEQLRKTHGWDSRQARAARFAYYDAAFVPEIAEVKKLRDANQGYDPGTPLSRPRKHPQARSDYLATHRRRSVPGQDQGQDRLER